MFEKLIKIRTQLPYLPDTIRLIWDAASGWMIAWALLLVLQGLLPVALVYLTGVFVDSLNGVIQTTGWSTYTQTIQSGILIALVLLSTATLASLTTWVRTIQAERVQDHIYDRIHAKAIELDLSYYDSPGYYDRLYRARLDAYDRPVSLLENLGALIQNMLTFLAMAVILIRFAWWLPIILVVGMVPALIVVAKTAYSEYDWRQRSTETRRRTNFYDWIITDRDSAAELRLFALGDLFRNSYQRLRERLRIEHAVLLRSQVFLEVTASLVALLTMGFVMGWMVWRLTLGMVSLGQVAMLFQAFNQGQKLMQTLLGSLGQIIQNLLFLDNLFEFLKMEPKQPLMPVSNPIGPSLDYGIFFENVTFRYEGSDCAALTDFNLVVPAGQISAIVGENGAGKSTLVKLLCRFYDPEAGTVRIDGVDLRYVNPEDIWQKMTVLFQQPVHYHETAYNNIAFGNLSLNPMESQVIRAGKAAGADELITRLPEGYKTVLGSWFGGAELSIGEWQRIALARAFLRQAPIMILDEPTSAMDSWAEIEWMSRCRSLMAGRTVLLITHRFTTAMQADIIHVMIAGRIVESGTHQDLLALNGKYADSWKKQMRQKV